MIKTGGKYRITNDEWEVHSYNGRSRSDSSLRPWFEFPGGQIFRREQYRWLRKDARRIDESGPDCSAKDFRLGDQMGRRCAGKPVGSVDVEVNDFGGGSFRRWRQARGGRIDGRDVDVRPRPCDFKWAIWSESRAPRYRKFLSLGARASRPQWNFFWGGTRIGQDARDPRKGTLLPESPCGSSRVAQ